MCAASLSQLRATWQCTRRFTRRSQSSAPTVTKPLLYSCTWRTNSTKSNLTMHQKVHQEKSVICPHCDKAFTLPEEPPVTERPSKPAAVQQHRGCTESTKRQLNRKSLTSEQPKQQAEVAPSTESTSTDVAAVVARPSVSVNMSNCYNWCTCYTAWQFITHLEEDWL